jgi:hypothetical protein
MEYSIALLSDAGYFITEHGISLLDFVELNGVRDTVHGMESASRT